MEGQAEDRDWFRLYFEGDDYEAFNAEVMSPELSRWQVDHAVEWAAVQPGDRVLDVACGSGRHSLELSRRGFSVVGLDLSSHQLVRAQERQQAGCRPVPLVRADMRRLPVADASQAAVFCLFHNFGFFSQEDNRAVLEEFYRVLRPGARVVLDVPNRDVYLRHHSPRVWDRVEGGLVMQEIEVLPWTSRLSVQWTFLGNDGQRREVTTCNRIYSAHELVALFQDAGFQVFSMWDFTTGSPFQWQGTEWMLLVARKRSAPVSR